MILFRYPKKKTMEFRGNLTLSVSNTNKQVIVDDGEKVYVLPQDGLLRIDVRDDNGKEEV